MQIEPDHTQAYVTAASAIVVALIGATALWDKVFKRHPPAEESDYELKFTLDDLVLIREKITGLIETTKLDRFLILKAENGKKAPKWATAVYSQYRQEPKVVATTAYHKVRIDDHYREMLIKAEDDDVVTLTTSNMALNSRLRAIYESEGIYHSNVYFTCRYPLQKNENKWMIFYFTMATKSKECFTPDESTAFRLFADWMRDLFATEIDAEHTI